MLAAAGAASASASAAAAAAAVGSGGARMAEAVVVGDGGGDGAAVVVTGGGVAGGGVAGVAGVAAFFAASSCCCSILSLSWTHVVMMSTARSHPNFRASFCCAFAPRIIMWLYTVTSVLQCFFVWWLPFETIAHDVISEAWAQPLRHNVPQVGRGTATFHRLQNLSQRPWSTIADLPHAFQSWSGVERAEARWDEARRRETTRVGR